MRNFKVEAIIIGAVKVGDADKILRVFSREKGKLSLKAKGIRRIKSKLRGHLSTLDVVKIEAVKGKKNLDIITGAVCQNSHANMRGDLDKVSQGYFIAEFIDRSVIEGQKNEALYFLIKNTLEVLEETEIDLELLKLAFIYKATHILGHKPTINKCSACSTEVRDDLRLVFDMEQGGVACKSCSDHSLDISYESLKTLNAIEKIDIHKISAVKFDLHVTKESLRHIELFVNTVFDRDYKSNSFIKQLAMS